MAQKVKIYPLNSFGGRIQALMKKNEMTIVDLYLEMTGKSESDLPKYEYGDSNNNTAYHQVKNWLNEKGIDKKKLERLCEIFNVSADYLLGTDTEVNDTLQAIHDYTGLSSEAIEVLRTYNKGDNARLFNLILQQDNGLGMVIHYMRKCIIVKKEMENERQLLQEYKNNLDSIRDNWEHDALKEAQDKGEYTRNTADIFNRFTGLKEQQDTFRFRLNESLTMLLNNIIPPDTKGLSDNK